MPVEVHVNAFTTWLLHQHVQHTMQVIHPPKEVAALMWSIKHIGQTTTWMDAFAQPLTLQLSGSAV